VIVPLGQFGWDAVFRALAKLGHLARPRPRFGHGAQARVGPYEVIGSFHPSQQNTFTGKLSQEQLVDVLRRARELGAA
jgi:uracil-DNA glycosylase